MSGQALRKQVWEELDGVVLLDTFDNSYQPLRTLKISKRHLDTPRMVVWGWSNEPTSHQMSVLEGADTNDSAFPKIYDKSDTQTLLTHLKSNTSVVGKVQAMFEAAGSVAAGQSSELSLYFYSRGIDLQAFTKYVNSHKPCDGWSSLTESYKSLRGHGRCGVITEVFYGSKVQIGATSTSQVGASVTVPAPATGAPVPGNIGGEVSVDRTKEADHSMTTENGELKPFAFRFAILRWDGTEWHINENPHIGVPRIAAATMDADHVIEVPDIEKHIGLPGIAAAMMDADKFFEVPDIEEQQPPEDQETT